jgi:hypothetical protein
LVVHRECTPGGFEHPGGAVSSVGALGSPMSCLPQVPSPSLCWVTERAGPIHVITGLLAGVEAFKAGTWPPGSKRPWK